jgi:pantoate--beta-alanine ligase
MEVFEGIDALRSKLEELKKVGKTIGFVPTMGALHQGHCSLVQRSKSETDCTVVSIFVNPTQFNDKKDLENYPRSFENDSKLLEKLDTDIVFYPSVKEMYPEDSNEHWDFGMLDKVMEGAHRPGHFNGVAIIVKKLFDIVMPHKAYFGLKDFQQLTIIKVLVRRLEYPIEIVECEIVRDTDGLALSSRNALLSTEERSHAVNISKTLFQAKRKAPGMSINEIETFVINTLNNDGLLKVEYFQIVDNVALQAVNNWNEPNVKVGCVAVKVGTIRLIDNIVFSV